MKKIPSHRRWRGVNDTLEDFLWWLRTWGKMLSFLLRSPRRTVQELFNYDLGETFVSVPGIVDNFVGGASGAGLREKHREINAYIQSCFDCCDAVFNADGKTVYIEGEGAEKIMRGFPGVKTVSIPVAVLLFEKLPDCAVCSVVCTAEHTKNAPSPVFVLGDGEIIESIRFIEKHTGEKFDWDIFTERTGKRPTEVLEFLTRPYF